LHEEISDHYITTVRPDYLEVTVNPEVIENPEVAKDREEVIETVLPTDGGMYTRLDDNNSAQAEYGEKDIETNLVDTGSAYKNKQIYDLKGHKDTSIKVKMLLKNYQSMQDVLNQQQREEVEVLKKSVLLNKIQKVADVLESKEDKPKDAPEPETEEPRAGNPKFKTATKDELIHEQVTIEVPKADVEIVIKMDELEEVAPKDSDKDYKPNLLDDSEEEADGIENILEEGDEKADDTQARDGRIVNKNGQRRNTKGGGAIRISRPTGNNYDPGFSTGGGALHQNVHNHHHHVHDHRDQSLNYYDSSSGQEESPDWATCRDSMDCAHKTEMEKKNHKIEISVNIEEESSPNHHKTLKQPSDASGSKTTDSGSMFGWIGDLVGL